LVFSFTNLRVKTRGKQIAAPTGLKCKNIEFVNHFIYSQTTTEIFLPLQGSGAGEQVASAEVCEDAQIWFACAGQLDQPHRFKIACGPWFFLSLNLRVKTRGKQIAAPTGLKCKNIEFVNHFIYSQTTTEIFLPLHGSGAGEQVASAEVCEDAQIWFACAGQMDQPHRTKLTCGPRFLLSLNPRVKTRGKQIAALTGLKCKNIEFVNHFIYSQTTTEIFLPLQGSGAGEQVASAGVCEDAQIPCACAGQMDQPHTFKIACGPWSCLSFNPRVKTRGNQIAAPTGLERFTYSQTSNEILLPYKPRYPGRLPGYLVPKPKPMRVLLYMWLLTV